MADVRIVGTSEKFQSDGLEYLGWRVDILNSDGEWTMVTICFGPSAASSAIAIANTWFNNCVSSPAGVVNFQ